MPPPACRRRGSQEPSATLAVRTAEPPASRRRMMASGVPKMPKVMPRPRQIVRRRWRCRQNVGHSGPGECPSATSPSPSGGSPPFLAALDMAIGRLLPQEAPGRDEPAHPLLRAGSALSSTSRASRPSRRDRVGIGSRRRQARESGDEPARDQEGHHANLGNRRLRGAGANATHGASGAGAGTARRADPDGRGGGRRLGHPRTRGRLADGVAVPTDPRPGRRRHCRRPRRQGDRVRRGRPRLRL